MTKHARLPLAAAAALALATALPAAAHAGPQLYTADGIGNTVTRVMLDAQGAIPDTHANAHTAAGRTVVAFRLSPGGDHGYALDQADDTISQFAVGADGALAAAVPATVATITAPVDLAVAPDGRHVFVLSATAIQTFDVDADGDLHPADVATVAHPGTEMALSADGRWLLAIDPSDELLLRYAVAADGTVTAAGSADAPTSAEGPGDPPTGLAVSNDSRRVYVTTNETIRSFAVSTLEPGPVTTTASRLFAGVVVAPDDRHVLTSGEGLQNFDVGPDGSLVLRAATGDASASSARLVLAPDGDSVYAGADNVGSIFQYSIGETGALTAKSSGVSMVDGTSFAPRSLAVTPSADVAVTQALPSTPASAGGVLEYRIVVTNRQGFPATGVRVRSDLPADLTLLSAAAGDDATCAAGGEVDCAIRAVPEGGTATITVRARTLTAGTPTLTARAQALQPDPDPSDNATTDSAAVEPRPGAISVAATDVTATAARLTGVAAPAGTGARYRFELGTTTAYGTATGWADAGPGIDGRAVTAAVDGLVPETTYHFRLVVTNDQGATTTGDDATFTTPAATVATRVDPAPPAPAPGPAPSPSPAPPTTPATSPDRTAPRVSAVALTRRAVRLRVSEAVTGKATISVAHVKHVRRHGRRVAVTTWKAARTLTLRATSAGRLDVKIGRPLPAGRYRVALKLSDAAGHRATPASFTVRVR